MTALNEHLRCERHRCRKIPRGKLRLAERERYAPYCSFHCQEWARLEGAQAYVNRLRKTQP
jgi:hypothetical protein